MKRILAGLATLALTAAASAASAQAVQSPDPIGDLIAATTGSPADSAAWSLRATLYHGGGRMSTHDSIGCRVSPMRTVAIDSRLIARGAILFIKETVGILLPGGGHHDGYWYASDTGALIKGQKIDLFTGPDGASMSPMLPLNLKALTVRKVGQFKGCPPVDGAAAMTLIAKAGSATSMGQTATRTKWARGERAKLLASGSSAVGLDGGGDAKPRPVVTSVAFREPNVAE